MTDAIRNFSSFLAEGRECLQIYDATGRLFALRHVWICSVSAFDNYMTELISEVGLRLIDRNPMVLTANLRQIDVPLGDIWVYERLNPAERLIFFKEHIFSFIQYKSFYRPDKVSEALSYIWTCPAKEKWTRIQSRMVSTGRYPGKTEQDIRVELDQIGSRRDIIAHAADVSPGNTERNDAKRKDATQVLQFVNDLAMSIDDETESQLI